MSDVNRLTTAPAVPGYSSTARLLHWLTAVIVIGLVLVGLVMTNMPSGPTQNLLFNLHRSTGVVLLPIILFRLAYRLSHPPPPLPADIPALQRMAAEGMHWTLYALLVVQPIIGWVATSAYRAPIVVFWLFELPPIAAENRAFSEQAFAVHRVIGILLAFLITAHAAAALFHHFVRKDQVLLRMVRG